ncbi:hypothetical protein B0H14DRAFT_2587478 [Mycena olivaceomarginata]|nr:hypothetical protein B0H14DRAFT_2587478 [Mycena olivaceomarginata]
MSQPAYGNRARHIWLASRRQTGHEPSQDSLKGPTGSKSEQSLAKRNRAKKLDSDTVRVVRATMTSGVLENPNNSLQSRFKNQSQRQEQNRVKQLNLESITGRETMKLRAQAKDDKLEITKLRKQIEVLSPATPQTP